MKRYCLLLTLFYSIHSAFADTVKYPLYIGLQAGYGSTNWNSLSNHDKDYPDEVLTTVPEKADDTGLDYGAFIGYQFTKKPAGPHRRDQLIFFAFPIIFPNSI